jgi:chromate reductase, NAD(P)H dehydrogenase (quinone)
MKKVLCISGSVRSNSTCMTILKTIAERNAAKADFIFYQRLAALPHFDPDAEDSTLPELVLGLREQVAAADAVIFCTPEYVFSVPAILKNAIEWCVASTVFSDKPTAMIVASGGGEKTFESLGLILKTIQTKITAETMLCFSGVRGRMRGQSHVSDAGDLEKLDTLTQALLKEN